MMLPLSYRSVWGLKGHLRAAEEGAAGNFQMQNSCTLLLRDLYLHIAQPVIVPLSIMEARGHHLYSYIFAYISHAPR